MNIAIVRAFVAARRELSLCATVCLLLAQSWRRKKQDECNKCRAQQVDKARLHVHKSRPRLCEKLSPTYCLIHRNRNGRHWGEIKATTTRSECSLLYRRLYTRGRHYFNRMKKFTIEIMTVFTITLVVCIVVTFIWNLALHSVATVDWETSFRYATIFGIIFPVINSRKKS